jgi:hypothetical protein
MSVAIEKLETRARAIRSRAATRAWEIRQHAHARGVWFQVERLFALTERAFALTDADVQTLLASGHQPHDVGLHLQPPRRFFVVDAADIAQVAGAREVTVVRSSAIITAPALALVLFR